MPGKSHPRASHPRRTKHGVTQVRSTMVTRQEGARKKQKAMHLKCRHCGAAIVRIKMANSGTIHYDDVEGLHRVKHRCNTIGSRLSKKRDDQTPDLFERDGGEISRDETSQD